MKYRILRSRIKSSDVYETHEVIILVQRFEENHPRPTEYYTCEKIFPFQLKPFISWSIGKIQDAILANYLKKDKKTK